MQHLRMSGVYWATTAAHLMGVSLLTHPKVGEIFDYKKYINQCKIVTQIDGVETIPKQIVSFSGNIGHDSHLLYTLSALQILAMEDSIHKMLNETEIENILIYIATLQNDDGSFKGDIWGEIDTRFSYCALSCYAILGMC